MSIFNYNRRKTVAVNIGGTPLGSDYPIRLQSMASTSTMDTDGSVAQCQRIADAGAAYIRLTAQGVREAENLGNIKSQLRKNGVTTPLVADIHFNPRAAFAAAEVVEKVRINPGNFVDPGRTFQQLTYTDEEYAEEIKKIEATFIPFLDLCRKNNTAIRIGVNHGSLSDRIMSRYGDTPAGMVESAMEFLRVCVAQNFLNVVISIKASNTVIMVETMRRLVVAMEKENMHFPLHLGVTEAGDGGDGCTLQLAVNKLVGLHNKSRTCNKFKGKASVNTDNLIIISRRGLYKLRAERKHNTSLFIGRSITELFHCGNLRSKCR